MPTQNVRSTRRKQVSPKQHARIWFEFYKLALDDPRHALDVRRSKAYYRPWGDVRGVAFDPWWAEHSYLFDEAQVSEASTVRLEPAAVYVRIPISMSATAASAQVRELLLEKQKVWSEKLGVAVQRGARVGGAQFHLTPGARFLGRAADLSLRLYRDIYIPAGSPPIGEEFAAAVALHFRENSRIKMHPIYLPKSGLGPFGEEAIRSLRRSIAKAKALTAAAARGDFPGQTQSKC